MPNTGQLPSVDQIIQQNDKQMMQRLQKEFTKVASEVRQQVEDDKRSIRSKHMFAEANLKRQWDAEKDPGRKQTLLNQKKTLESQTLSKLADVDNKYFPTNRSMKQAYDTEIQKLQQAAQKRDFELQVLRKNVGNFKSNALARQAEYKAIGIDVPLSQLEVKPNPEQRKAMLVRDIKNLDEMLDRFTPVRDRTLIKDKGIWWGTTGGDYIDPITGEERKLDPEKPEDKVIIDKMNALIEQRENLRGKLQELYLQIPEYRQVIQDQQNRRNAKNIHLPSNSAAKGGGIKESITNLNSKHKKGRIRVKYTGGQNGTVNEKEIAS